MKVLRGFWGLEEASEQLERAGEECGAAKREWSKAIPRYLAQGNCGKNSIFKARDCETVQETCMSTL